MLPAVTALALALTLATGCTAPTEPNAIVRESADPSGFRGAALPDPYVMPDSTLVDTAGQSFNLRRSPSKPVRLLFFGYTNCPDVCTTVLAEIATALGRLDPSVRDQVQVLFITTDPSRDTGQRMRSYLDRFDPSFIGLTGDLAAVKAVAERVGVEIAGLKRLPGGGYEVGHGAQVIGFDKSSSGVVVWTQPTPVADLMHDLTLLVDKQR